MNIDTCSDKRLNLKDVILALVFPMATTLWGHYWGRFGIDVTDTGFFLQLQQQIVNGKINEISSPYLWFGTDLLGAMWLSLAEPNLLHARTGSHFLTGIIGSIVFLTSKKIIGDSTKSAILVTFIYVIFWVFTGFQIINYGLAPLLPIALLFFTLTFIVNKECGSIINLSVGFILALIVFMRVPLIIFSICFLIIFLSQQVHALKNLRVSDILLEALSRFSIIALGSFTATLTLLAFPFVFNTFQQVGTHFLAEGLTYSENVNHFKTGFEEINGYDVNHQAFRWIVGSLIIVFFGFFYISIGALMSTTKSKVLSAAIPLLCFGIPIFVKQRFSMESEVYYSIVVRGVDYFYSFTYFAPVFVLTMCGFILWKFSKEIDRADKFLVKTIIAFTVLFPLGSNSFEKQMVLSAPITIPLLLSIIIKFNKQYVFYSRELVSKMFKVALHSSLCFVPAILFVKIVTLKPFNDEHYNLLTHKLEHQSLKGIVTTKQKADMLNVIMPIAFKYCGEKTLLANGRANLFNYALNANFVFPSFDPFGTSSEYFEAVLKTSPPPGCILLSDIDFSSSSWQKIILSKTSKKDVLTQVNLSYTQEYIAKNNYKLVVDHEGVSIYAYTSSH